MSKPTITICAWCDVQKVETKALSALGYPVSHGICAKHAGEMSAGYVRTNGWQPIATAPQDGTYVLLAGPSGYVTTPLRVEVGMWDAPAPEDGPRYKGGWRTFSHDWFTDGGEEPTHWMPLPPAPEGVE